jgi:hypothetical protein
VNLVLDGDRDAVELAKPVHTPHALSRPRSRARRADGPPGVGAASESGRRCGRNYLSVAPALTAALTAMSASCSATRAETKSGHLPQEGTVGIEGGSLGWIHRATPPEGTEYCRVLQGCDCGPRCLGLVGLGLASTDDLAAATGSRSWAGLAVGARGRFPMHR